MDKMSANLENGKAVALIKAHMLNRFDRLAFFAPWGKACPIETNGNLDDILTAHLLGDRAPSVTVKWIAEKKGKSGFKVGRFRVGTYSPAPNGMTKFGCIDADGGGRHGHPLAHPLAVAMAIVLKARELGLSAHLEKSGGGEGWHIWMFFAEPVSARDVRRLLFALIPPDVRLMDGLPADPQGNKGVEVFPKQDSIADCAYGNLVWLPWWSEGKDGANHFHLIDDFGNVAAYFPFDFATITATEMAAALAKLKPPTQAKEQSAPSSTASEEELAALFPEQRQRKRGLPPESSVRTREIMLEAIQHVPNGPTVPYEGSSNGPSWLGMGMAIHSVDPTAAGLKVWEDWSAKCKEKHNKKCTCAEKWRSFGKFNGNMITIGSLVMWARANDLTCPTNLPLTDVGNAQRFAAEHRKNVLHCHPWNKWLIWDGTRWRVDDTGKVKALAKQTVLRLYREAQAKVKALELGGTDTEKDLADETLKWAHRSQDAKRINAPLDLARSEAGIPVRPADLDRDPWLLNLQNGTLDLQTGRLRVHRQGDYITKFAPVRFDSAAKCPLWASFLAEILPEVAIVLYLRRLAGLWMTGRTNEHILPVLYGKGSNRKSTFIKILFTVLGRDYSGKAPRNLLIAAKGEKHPTSQAWLHGKRFVAGIESDQGERLDESLVKELTGGDEITARRMRENDWTFDPSHKIALVTNHKPTIQGTDYAMWRRLRLIPFTVTISPDKDDKKLIDKLQLELPGILNWMLAGCLEWQQIGLADPPEVIAATRAYQTEQDKLGAFIAERCEFGNGFKSRVTQFYGVYKSWCKANGEMGTNSTAFGLALAERDIKKDKGRRNYLGIRLRELESVGGEADAAAGAGSADRAV